MTPRTAENRTAWEQAYETIQGLILGMEIQPGAAVTETALSQRLGLSRTPVREAFKRLEQEGLIVTTNHRKRVYILSIREMEELFDLKICLEGTVARWAAERADDNARRRLRDALVRMKRVAAACPAGAAKEQAWLENWLDSDQRFHDTLFDMAANKRARQVIRTCNMQWHRLRLGMLTLEGRIERSVAEHEAIALAILDGRPAIAQKAMETHLQNLKRELVKVMGLLHYPTV
jgi:GntR family transcriptional regulator, rspAB operon transcriptional repressor